LIFDDSLTFLLIIDVDLWSTVKLFSSTISLYYIDHIFFIFCKIRQNFL